MAKLPELRVQRQVPEMQSPKAAALPGQLRNISSAVQAVNQIGGQVANTFLKKWDAEARVEASALANQVQREYITRASELSREYHQDRTKPSHQFISDLTSLRREVFNEARQGTNQLTQRYLDPQLDNYNTQMTAADVEAATALTESRTLMSLADTEAGMMEALATTPQSYDEIIGAAVKSWQESELPAATVQENVARLEQEGLVTSINELLSDGDVATAVSLQNNSKAFKRIDPAVRMQAESAIRDAAVAQRGERLRELGNLLVADKLTLPKSLDILDTELSGMEGLNGYEEGEFLREAKAAMVLIDLNDTVYEDPQKVIDAIESAEYGKLLEPEDSLTLLNNARRELKARAEGNGTVTNRELASLQGEIDTLVQGALDDPLEGEDKIARAAQLQQQRIDMMTKAGRTVPESEHIALDDMKVAAERARIEARFMYEPEENVSFITSALPPTDEVEQEKFQIALDAYNKRLELMESDPVSYMRRAAVVGELPEDPGDPNWVPAFITRMNAIQGLRPVYGENAKFYLDNFEGERLVNFLTEKQGTQEFWDFLASTHEVLSPTEARELFTQVMPNDNVAVTVTMTAASLAAEGQTAIAQEILMGQALIDDEQVLRPENMNEILRSINRHLGSAYGNTPAFFAHRRAILAQYAYIRTRAGTRSEAIGGTNYDDDAMAEAVERVTGGVMEYGGKEYVAPVRGMKSFDFRTFMYYLRGETMPPLYDTNNNQIAPENFPAKLDDAFATDRFELVETGTPGRYYVQDNRSVGERAGSDPGAFLLDKFGNPAIVKYEDVMRKGAALSLGPRPRRLAR